MKFLNGETALNYMIAFAFGFVFCMWSGAADAAPSVNMKKCLEMANEKEALVYFERVERSCEVLMDRKRPSLAFVKKNLNKWNSKKIGKMVQERRESVLAGLCEAIDIDACPNYLDGGKGMPLNVVMQAAYAPKSGKHYIMLGKNTGSSLSKRFKSILVHELAHIVAYDDHGATHDHAEDYTAVCVDLVEKTGVSLDSCNATD